MFPTTSASRFENATLYRSLEDKATEYESLKDFNENIIKSISVGVMVEIGDRIIGWNRALEKLTGSPRSKMIGKSTSEVIPPQSLERLREERNLYKHRWGDLVVNFSATPLVDKEDREAGRLIIVDDITERVRLEDQLSQQDKLTSMGLLAARRCPRSEHTAGGHLQLLAVVAQAAQSR